MNKAFFDIGKTYPLLLLLLVIIFYSPKLVFAQPNGFSDELVIDGWSQAVGVTFDENGRMYVWEKGGKVWAVENGVKTSEPLIDISEEVGNWRDFGLIGFALDPNFLNNGYIYLWYVVDRHHLLNFGTPNYNANASSEKEATIARLTRYTANSANNFMTADYSSRKILIGESKSSGPPILHESHGAGQIIFGTDGTLMVTVGDGASYANPVDEGSHPATYYQQALNDGIITPAQNIGAYRCQSLNNLSGKILRIDPETGNGVPSNPYFQSNNPRSPQSRTWSIGIRNPYRIALKPETGSHNATDGNPGTFFFGDVGWSTWEDLNVVEKAGQNFGWPIYEGINQKAGYNNPIYAISDAEYVRPKVDWRHGADQARAYVNNQITNIGNGIVSGKQFRGNSSTGGVWYTGDDFPEGYRNTYFHADYSAGWIRNFGFDDNNNPTFVNDFKLNAGAVVFLNTSPIEDGLYYVRYPNQIRRITYTGNSNKQPIAIVEMDRNYGSSPLTVKFDASQSFDPEFSPLSFLWDFGGNVTSTKANPTILFEASSTAPKTYPVRLSVTDEQGATTEKIIPISLNNSPPIIVSTSIDNTNSFSADNGATFNLNAIVTDNEHNGQLKYEWQTALFHNGHSHAEPIDNNPSTTTALSPIDCDGSSYWFRVTLKVTDPEGLFTTFQKDIFPDCQGLPQTINYAPIADQSITAGDIVLNATATSGLPVSMYLLEGPAVIFGNKIVPSGFPGKVTIRATQGGNEVYQPANPIESSFNIVLPTNASCRAEGLISRDIWNGGGRNTINDIPVNAAPNETNTLTSFEVTPFTAIDNAQRVRGFICPPATGLYTFWIASDDDSQLWLSTNGNPKNRRLIANVKGNTQANQWNKYATQQSEPIFLVAGNQYYIESLMNGGGHLSAGWKMPDNSLDRPISGEYLSTYKDKQEQTITFFGIPDKLTNDPAFTVGAVANSDLPVDFSIVSGPATVSGTTVTLTGAVGTVIIRAKQNGNDQFLAASSVERRFEVIALPTLPSVTITSPSNRSSFTENSINVQYFLSGNLVFHDADHLLVSLDNQPTVDVHTLSGVYALNNLTEGEHTLKMQLADSNHRPFANPEATAFISFSIIPSEKEQTINFFPISDKLTTTIPFSISASATSGLPVTLRVASGPASMSGNTISLNGTTGIVVIEASQNGNEAYKPAESVRQSFVVSEPAIERLSQTISFDPIFNKFTTDPPFEVNVSASSGLPIDLMIESGPATVEGKKITLTGVPGTVVIRANQAGNTQYKRAISFGRSFSVSEKIKQNQTISFYPIFNKKADDAAFSISASSSSGLPVKFSILSGPASVNESTVTLNGTAGTVIIRASQAGNEDYNAAVNYDRSFIVNPADVAKINQLINFSSISSKLTTNLPFSISASSSSGLPVSFSIVSGPASINGSTVTLNGTAGTVIVRASQSGNSEYLSAPNVDRPFNVVVPEVEEVSDDNSPADYCTLKSLFPWQEWIGQVIFGDLNNTSSKNIYKLYEEETLVQKGESYSLIVKPAFSWTQWDEYITVWIDYNGDGDFNDTGENIISTVSAAGLPQQTITGISVDVLIPTDAVVGKTRMRVAMQRESAAAACGTVNQGEVEDYILNIVEGNTTPISNEKQNQTINFPTIPDQLTSTTSITLNAVASSGLPVLYSILSGPASVNNNILTLTRNEGTVVVNAQQNGNNEFFAAQTMNRAFRVSAPSLLEDNEAPTIVDYCTAKGNFPWQEWISNVSLGTINHNSGKDGYGDFTNQHTTLNKGVSYDISVSPAFSWTQWDEYITVWIDFNQNGRFDDIGEEVLSGISIAGTAQSIPQTVSGTITIPQTAKDGETRMRVAMQQGLTANVCENFELGEVEDYTINIVGSNVVGNATGRAKQILTFSAYTDANQEVELEWISNGDMEADNYQIERSTDNFNFYKIKDTAPQSGTVDANFYTDVDETPLKGTTYYRIKQLNKNGSFKYSNAVTVDRAYGIEEFYLFPNPVEEIVHVHLKPFLGKAIDLRIYNSYGQLVKESKLQNVQMPTLSFDMGNEQNGMYYLYIKSKGRKDIGKKFILNRDY